MPATVTVKKDGTGDYTTIASAISGVDVMGTVYVGSGTYTEYINLTQQIAGGWGKPIRLVALSTASGQKPIINGSSFTASAIVFDANVQAANTMSLYVEGFAFVSCSHLNGVFKMGGNRSVSVYNCEFYSCTTTLVKGLFSDATYTASFQRNYCYNVGAIYNANVGTYSRVYNNYGYFTSDITAVNVNNANAFVVNNTFIFNNSVSTKGIVAGRAMNNIVINRGSGWRSIEAAGTASYNCVSGTWSLAVSGTFITGNITADPIFTNSTLSAGTASLSSSSPCVNAGADVSAFFTVDLLGVTRTGSFDIGAYEYVYVPSNPWTGFSTASSYVKTVINNGIVINRHRNIDLEHSKRSGLSAQNGTTPVPNVPYVLSTPGPISLRGRKKPYATTTNPSGTNTPESLGY